MKSIIMILVLAAIGAGVGFIATAEIARQQQNAAAESLKPTTGDSQKDMQESLRYMSASSGDLAKRQTYAMIGGGVGLVVGLLAGFAIVTMLDRKKRGTATAAR